MIETMNVSWSMLVDGVDFLRYLSKRLRQHLPEMCGMKTRGRTDLKTLLNWFELKTTRKRPLEVLKHHK